MLDVVAELASRYAARENFLGIEPIDEVQGRSRRGLSLVEGVPPHLLRNFYRDAYEALRDAAGTRPVLVLHDACLPDACARSCRRHDTSTSGSTATSTTMPSR